MNWQIPFFDPDLGEAELEAVAQVVRSKWLTMGVRTAQFESEFASLVGCQHAVALNSCTAALHVALLALDVGERRIGLATWDARHGAREAGLLRRSSLAQDLARLETLVGERRVTRLVVGLPRNLDGSEGPRCQSVRQFTANIARHGPPALAALPIVLQDERLSTAAVTRGMIEDYDMSRARRAERIDAAAAAWFLESALARLK